MAKPQRAPTAPKNKGFAIAHAQIGEKTFCTVAPPSFNRLKPNLVCGHFGAKASFTVKPGNRVEKYVVGDHLFTER